MNNHKRNRGVNLVETMIVVGIMGLLLGISIGLLSIVHSWMKSNETVVEISSIVSAFHRSDYNEDYNSFDMTAFANSGMVPKRWVANGIIIDPFGGALSLSANDAGNGDKSIRISMHAIPKAACNAIISNSWGNSLQSILVNGQKVSVFQGCSSSTNTVVMNFN